MFERACRRKELHPVNAKLLGVVTGKRQRSAPNRFSEAAPEPAPVRDEWQQVPAEMLLGDGAVPGGRKGQGAKSKKGGKRAPRAEPSEAPPRPVSLLTNVLSHCAVKKLLDEFVSVAYQLLKGGRCKLGSAMVLCWKFESRNSRSPGLRVDM